MRRTAVLCGVFVLTATGTWALAAPRTASTPVRVHAEPAGAPAPTAPEVALPEVATPKVSTAPEPPTHGPTPDTADHLVVEPVVVEAPASVVTTSTAPPTTTSAPPAPTTTAAIVTVAFHATQAYGSCEEPVPYDVFSGTATPGSTVTISSPYGSGSTTADAAGHWQRKVEFPTAPRNQTFSVTATGRGGSHTMQFIATGGADHA